MSQGIKILYLEDDPGDAVRVEHKLRESGLEFELLRVESRDAFMAGLQPPPDVILSDHGLPSFDGLTAFGTAREKCPEVPFIFVTNALTREMEIEKLLGGVADYVRKDELDYLGVALRHALREAREWRLRRQRIKEYFNLSPGQAGMLPICSHCKKIRNNKNHWQPLEFFFLENLNIRFTHGLCPECTPKFFPLQSPPPSDR